jgi:hypothetical protein
MNNKITISHYALVCGSVVSNNPTNFIFKKTTPLFVSNYRRSALAKQFQSLFEMKSRHREQLPAFLQLRGGSDLVRARDATSDTISR